MAAKVALCPLWYTLAALQYCQKHCTDRLEEKAYPGDEDILGQRCVGVLDFEKSKLDAAIREFVN